MSDLWKPPWPLYYTSSSVSVLPITNSSYWLGSSYPIKSMLISEAEEWLLVLGELPWRRGLGEIPTELSNLCTELQSITSSSSMATTMCSLDLSWLPSSTLMLEVCCSLTCTRSGELTEGLFIRWLLGEPPPWARRDFFIQNINNFVMSAPYHLASSVMGAPLLMFPLLSRVEYPFSFLVMPSVETTANQARHTNISNTWRSGNTSLFALLHHPVPELWSLLGD